MSSEQKPADNIVVPLPPVGGDWKKWLVWVLAAALAITQALGFATNLTIVEQNKEVQKEVVKEKVKEAVREEIQSFIAQPVELKK